LLALALALLLGYWSAPRTHYPGLFHAHATPILANLTGRPVLLGAPEPAAEHYGDTLMKGYLEGFFRPAWTSQFSVARIGYWPSLLLTALLLATPLAPLRRALAVAAGLLLLDLVVLGRIALEIAYAYFEAEHGAGQAAQGLVHLLLRVGSESLTATIPSAAAVLLIWVLLANPRQSLDIGALRALLTRQPPAPPASGDPPAEKPETSRDPS
jgi:hypothetical protein